MRKSKKIAVIGAGLSGLVVARRLRDAAEVTIFEKSRGPGGRMATRRHGEFAFDHGAQFFTARTQSFREFLTPLLAAGVVSSWPATFVELDRHGTRAQRTWDEHHPHFVGTPAMNRIGKYLSDGLDILFETPVTEISWHDGSWVLRDGGGELGHFDWVVLTAPAPQAHSLAAASPALAELCAGRRMLGCYALMLGFSAPLQLAWQAALIRDADISWISVNSSKPGRNGAVTLVVHSTNAWAEAHLDEDTGFVLEHLLEAASAAVGVSLDAAVHRQVHRWRYANIDKQSGPACFIDGDARLAACGDWFLRGRVESAFTSASRLAARLAERLHL